jgi:hypothetical protein
MAVGFVFWNKEGWEGERADKEGRGYKGIGVGVLCQKSKRHKHPSAKSKLAAAGC